MAKNSNINTNNSQLQRKEKKQLYYNNLIEIQY